MEKKTWKSRSIIRIDLTYSNSVRRAVAINLERKKMFINFAVWKIGDEGFANKIIMIEEKVLVIVSVHRWVAIFSLRTRFSLMSSSSIIEIVFQIRQSFSFVQDHSMKFIFHMISISKEFHSILVLDSIQLRLKLFHKGGENRELYQYRSVRIFTGRNGSICIGFDRCRAMIGIRQGYRYSTWWWAPSRWVLTT